MKKFKNMEKITSTYLAELILKNSGLIKNRADLVLLVEEELSTIYSELDSSKPPEYAIENPPVYYEPVVTIFDLVSGGQIYTPLYKLISIEQRSFIRKITQNEDFYINIERGKRHSFNQKWKFNFKFRNKILQSGRDISFDFDLEIGVRDPFPYNIYITNFDDNLINDLYEYLISI